MASNEGFIVLSLSSFIAGSDQHFIFNTPFETTDITAVEWVLKSNTAFDAVVLIQKTLSNGVTLLGNGSIQVDLLGTDTSELRGKYTQYITIDTVERYRPAKGDIIINEY